MSAPPGNKYAAKAPEDRVYKKGRVVFDLGEERKQRFAKEARRAGHTLKGHLVSILDERWREPVTIKALEKEGYRRLSPTGFGPPMSFADSLDAFGICWRDMVNGNVRIIYSRANPPERFLSSDAWYRTTVAGNTDLLEELHWAQIHPDWLSDLSLGLAIAMLYEDWGATALFGLPPSGGGFRIVR